jgi:hypothetical protein
MASAVPLWLLGKEITITAKLLTIDTTTGAVTTGTAGVNFLGILDAGNPYSVNNEVTKVEISNMDNPYNNKVIIQQGSSMTVTEVLQASTSTAIGSTDANTGLAKNAIEKLWTSGFHYNIVATYKDPAGTVRRTNTGDWQYNGHQEGYTKGKSTMTLNLETFSTINAGVYNANPLYT